MTNWQPIIGYLSIIVIVISLLSINSELIGFAIDSSGSVNITIMSNTNINFSISGIDFGSGQVSAGNSSATIDSIGSVVGGNWTPVSDGFRLENVGNVNVSLNLKTGKDASGLIGGTNASYQYNVTERESGSCSLGAITLGEWNNVNTSGIGTKICDVFPFSPGYDEIDVDIKLVIPPDATAGAQSDIVTATATAIS